MAEDSGGRRRSRRRATAQQGPPAPAPDEAGTRPRQSEPTTQTEPTTQPRRRTEKRARGGRAATPRGERDLAGSGGSQVGPTGAMRARDLNRPTDEDLAEAEAQLTIVRRNWSPAGPGDDDHAPPRRRRS